MARDGKEENAAGEHAVRLESIAVRIEPRVSWDDLALPETTVSQLKDICSEARRIRQSYREWGFDRRIRPGESVNVLFNGPPETGKIMAAEALAADLAMPLYRIDLGAMAGKYIGETEKSLNRVFDSAERSNAILFFDAWESLFGARTEAPDTHDRYANSEAGYLLQRMEEHAGITILATNLRKVVDEAVVRRMRFVVEFSLPPANERRMNLWVMAVKWLRAILKKC